MNYRLFTFIMNGQETTISAEFTDEEAKQLSPEELERTLWARAHKRLLKELGRD